MIWFALLFAQADGQPPTRDHQVGFSEQVGNWAVAGDREVGGCMMQLKAGGPTALTVLSKPHQAELIFAISNPAWRSLKDGEGGRLWAHFWSNGELTDSWNLAVVSYNKAEASPVINFTIDRAHNDGASFIVQFSKAGQIRFMRDKIPVASFNLTGSARAIERLLVCREYLRSDPNFDPFAR